jgi:hypothetical protein
MGTLHIPNISMKLRWVELDIECLKVQVAIYCFNALRSSFQLLWACVKECWGSFLVNLIIIFPIGKCFPVLEVGSFEDHLEVVKRRP